VKSLPYKGIFLSLFTIDFLGEFSLCNLKSSLRALCHESCFCKRRGRGFVLLLGERVYQSVSKEMHSMKMVMLETSDCDDPHGQIN
jgi:hypothetical protein